MKTSSICFAEAEEEAIGAVLMKWNTVTRSMVEISNKHQRKAFIAPDEKNKPPTQRRDYT